MTVLSVSVMTNVVCESCCMLYYGFVGMNCLSRQLGAWMMSLHGRNVLIIPMHNLSIRHYGLFCPFVLWLCVINIFE